MLKLFEELPECQLIEACAAGNREAWTCMIKRYQPGMEGFLRKFLFRLGIKDVNVVFAMVSNVWSEQLESKRFATYDPRRGTLRKYLRGLARKHVLRWLHSRASITRCEREAMRRKPEMLADTDASLAIMLTDLLDQASPGERDYMHQELLKDRPGSQATPLSDVNKRQLHHRAVRRLCKFLGIRDKNHGAPNARSRRTQ
jgi:hypothetical protein